MATALPKLRSDLIVSLHETAEGRSFVIKEPTSGEFFRLGEAEHFIVQQLDGRTTRDLIRKRTAEAFDAELSDETLTAFLEQLRKRDLLESADQDQRKKKKPGHRMSGNPLYIRFRAIDPTRLFDYLLPRVSVFFTPPFVVLSAAIILFAIGIVIANFSELPAELARLYRLSSVPVLMTIVFLVVVAHEFAHGLTCRHFKGEVHELGFMLVYFQPALYCNVSDAWLFPEKSKRLWVGFAGPYVELFIWALAVIVWRLTDVQTWINYAALIIVATSSLKTVINLNPLVKLDGYYLLSDYLEMPNLRRRSFRYVGDMLRRLVGMSSQVTEGLSPRQRSIYVVYGILASLGSVSLLVYVLVTAGGYLVEGQKPATVAVTMALVGLKFRRRFRRLFGTVSVSPAEWLSQRFKSRIAWPRRRTVKAAIAGVALAILLFGHTERRVSGPFNTLPRQNADVRAGVDGIIEKVYVDEGDQVRQGDLIAKLFDHDLQADLQKAESDLAAKQARLRMLVVGTRPEEIELAKKQVETSRTKYQQASDLYQQARRSRDERLGLAETAIKKAEDQLQYADKTLKMQTTLRDNGLGAELQFDQAAEQAAVRKSELAEARAQRQVLVAEELAEIRKDVAITDKEVKEGEAKLRVLLAGTRREEIEALEADIQSSEAQRVLLREQTDRTRVLSPASGVVATSSRLLKEMNGQLVKKGDLIAKVYDFKTVTAQILVSEKEIAGVRVGQQVALRARAYPSETFRGTVTAIATSARGSSDNEQAATTSSGATEAKTIIVTTQIDNQSLLLKPEMTGQAKIFCGPRRILDLITKNAAQTLKIDFWSWW